MPLENYMMNDGEYLKKNQRSSKMLINLVMNLLANLLI